MTKKNQKKDVVADMVEEPKSISKIKPIKAASKEEKVVEKPSFTDDIKNKSSKPVINSKTSPSNPHEDKSLLHTVAAKIHEFCNMPTVQSGWNVVAMIEGMYPAISITAIHPAAEVKQQTKFHISAGKESLMVPEEGYYTTRG